MRAKLLLMASVLVAALPVSAQSVTHPSSGYGVMGSMTDGNAASPASQNSVVSLNLNLTNPNGASSCPVTMRAERRTTFGVLQAKGGGHESPWQRLYLEIDRGAHAVVEAKVTVHGTRAQAQMTPVVSRANKGAKDAAKSFTLRPGSTDAEKIASDLRLEGFTSVQSVSLDAVSYADGSRWIAGSARRCSVEPDPLMLISAR
jgi:hypothetical protein